MESQEIRQVSDMLESDVVVGVDGSPSSQAALRWALAEAHLRGARVQAVSCWEFPLYYG